MYNNSPIDTKEIGDYRISIYPDYDAECPVTNWDMGAEYIFEHLEHGGFRLSPDCDWKKWVSNMRDESLESILQRIAADVVEQKDIVNYIKAGKVQGVRLVYNSRDHQWQLQTKPVWRGTVDENAEWDTEWEVEPHELKTGDCRMELLEYWDEDEYLDLIKECAKDFVIKEWSSCGYSQGDEMRGIGYITKERFDKFCGFSSKKYKTWQEQALDIINAEVEEIGMWAWGDVKGFVLEKKVHFTKSYDDENREDEKDYEWEEVDSCWGFFMETEELIKEVISQHDLKETA